jgi:ATP-dependent RNA helicase DeaD
MQTFEDSGINPLLLKAVKELGFEKPTEIQQQTIPYILNNTNDLVALAQTGTGKTAAFGLPVIDRIDHDSKHTQVLILAPTRELCVQIGKDMLSFSKYIPKIKIATIYGGASANKQIEDLNKGCQIVAGTPGRVLDLINRNKLKVENIKYLVLDEADEMLDMGFKDELDAILSGTPPDRQTMLFSATMSKEVMKIAKTYMHKTEEIAIGQKNTGAENVKHRYYLSPAKERFHVLKRIIDAHPKIYGIVFCRTRTDTKEVADNLIESGYNADALHGDLSQEQRDYVMNRFRIKHLQLLVATDVAARGLDVDNLTHIINYNLPDDAKTYIHRSGRTGRAGKAGVSLSLVHSRELYRLREIEAELGKGISRKQIPGGREICEKQLFNLIEKVENVEVNYEEINPFMEMIRKKLNWIDREELVARFLSVEFNRFLSFYKDAPDLNVYEDTKGFDKTSGKNAKRTSRRGESTETASGFSKFIINIGSEKKMSPSKLIGVINDYTKSKQINIGRIDIMKDYSVFETDQKYEQDILAAFIDAKYKGMHLEVNISSKPWGSKKSKPKHHPRPNDTTGKKKKKKKSKDRF